MKIWLISSDIPMESALLSKQLKMAEEKLHIQVELRLLSWNRAYDTVIDAFKNNSAPDVFSIGTTWVQTMSYINYLAPVPPSFPTKLFLAPWLKDCIHYKENIYAVPFLAEAYVLMARQEILDKVGIQANDLKDWDSFFVSCQKISDHFKARGIEHIPMAFPLRPELGTLHRYVVWLYKGGWTFPRLHAGMEGIFRNDISTMALEHISKLLRASGADLKALQTDTKSLINRFYFAENAFTFLVGNGSTYVSDRMNETNVNNNISLYPLPSLVPYAKTFGGGSVLAVASTSRHQELAWEVVEFLTQEEVLMQLCAANGNIPPYECTFWSKYESDPYIKVLKDEFQNSMPYDFHPLWRVIEKTSGDYIAHYLWDSVAGKDPKPYEAADQTLEELDRQINALLGMMWEMQENETGKR